jgi:hypothetical protein
LPQYVNRLIFAPEFGPPIDKKDFGAIVVPDGKRNAPSLAPSNDSVMKI